MGKIKQEYIDQINKIQDEFSESIYQLGINHYNINKIHQRIDDLNNELKELEGNKKLIENKINSSEQSEKDLIELLSKEYPNEKIDMLTGDILS